MEIDFDANTVRGLAAPTGTGQAARQDEMATSLQQGRHTIWQPVGGILARTTNGPATGLVELSSNKIMLLTLDFDAATQEHAQFSVRMPKSWNEGTLTAVFSWSHAATTTNFGVVWGIQAVAVSDGDALDVAFGTGQTVTDAGGTANTEYVTSETPAITIAGGPDAEDRVIFQVYRAAANGSDTLAVDARLHGVTIYYTVNASVDA